jgi:hypothetical protein
LPQTHYQLLPTRDTLVHFLLTLRYGELVTWYMKAKLRCNTGVEISVGQRNGPSDILNLHFEAVFGRTFATNVRCCRHRYQ